jgi:hypothetical protein
MWSFFRNRNAVTEAQKIRQRPKSLGQLIADMGDYADLASHDVALKFWLPEPAKDALDESCLLSGQSVSGYLRQFLVIHCYGLFPYQIMAEAMPNFCSKEDSIMYSIPTPQVPKGKKPIDTYWVADLGKNIAPIKIWVPSRLKQDLGSLANHVGLTPSNYLREIVISRLLGHGTLPKRPEMMTLPMENVYKWIEDKPLDWIEVDQQTYEKYAVREVRTDWVDDSQTPEK